MLMVCPDAFFQSKPPLTSPAPFGRPGWRAAAATATPSAANMFRRDICGLWRPLRLRLIFRMSLIGLRNSVDSGRNEGALDRLLAAGDEIQTLLEVGERQLMGTDLVHRKHTGLDHLDGGGPAVRTEV